MLFLSIDLIKSISGEAHPLFSHSPSFVRILRRKDGAPFYDFRHVDTLSEIRSFNLFFDLLFFKVAYCLFYLRVALYISTISNDLGYQLLFVSFLIRIYYQWLELFRIELIMVFRKNIICFLSLICLFISILVLFFQCQLD